MEDNDIKRWQPLINRGVNRYARSVPRQQKEDLKQDCNLEIIRSEDKINAALADSEEHAAKLVSRIISSTLIDGFRRQRNLTQCASLSDPKVFREADRKGLALLPTAPADSVLFGRAIKVLNPQERRVLTLAAANSLSNCEIAKRMGISTRWVIKLKKSMLEKLKQELRGKDGDNQTGD
jgi:RNA polymerase sigma factor (sigma-70 family)